MDEQTAVQEALESFGFEYWQEEKLFVYESDAGVIVIEPADLNSFKDATDQIGLWMFKSLNSDFRIELAKIQSKLIKKMNLQDRKASNA